MQIDPHAWLVVLPLALGLVQARALPEEHLVKRWWSQARLADAWVSASLRGAPLPARVEPASRAERFGFWLVVVAFALTGLLSLAAYAGLLPG